MARVYLWAGARRQFDIEQPLSVTGNTVGDVIDNLLLLHPSQTFFQPTNYYFLVSFLTSFTMILLSFQFNRCQN